jgi:SAM-dependent methyltransferase
VGGDLDQARINVSEWRLRDHVAEYDRRELTPAEVVVLLRHRERLSGRVLEVGCGAGRVLSYLPQLSSHVYGVDISAAMVERARQVCPAATIVLGDLATLRTSVDGRFDAILLMDCLIDIYDDRQRRDVLHECKETLEPDGILIFSSHNLAYSPTPHWRTARRSAVIAMLDQVGHMPAADVARALRRLPRRMRNRHRLAPMQERHSGFAILNDEGLDFALLHYYIARDHQEDQLDAAGYELLDCIDGDGTPVPHGELGTSPWLHFVAGPRPCA